MRVAVIGGGISGLAAAAELASEHEVSVFERSGQLGGHTYTVDVEADGQTYAVDMGFIVFNRLNYPGFSAMLDTLGVDSRATEMSFAFSDPLEDVEYNATRLRTLFAQPRNLLRPGFLRMVRDILRFYREAPALLHGENSDLTLDDYLAQNGYSREFAQWHLLPMAQALWSSPAEQIGEFPAICLAQFMHNHRMLQVAGRPQWRTVQGGSVRYVEAWRRGFPGRVELDSPVRSVHRVRAGIDVVTGQGRARFDRVVLACHSDQALALLEHPSAMEREVLGAIRYQPNQVDLHWDARLLPKRRNCWAAWNIVKAPDSARVSVTYDMNILQGLKAPLPLAVTLNRHGDIAPDKLIHSTSMSHPIYSLEMLRAQHRWAEIDDNGGVHFAGAYWGFGFHEDGFQSGLRAARSLRGGLRAAA